MNVKRFLIFVAKFTVALVVTTYVVGLFAYPLLTKDRFENPNSVLARTYRTPTEPELWKQVYIWVFPVQILRAILLALGIWPASCRGLWPGIRSARCIESHHLKDPLMVKFF